MNLRVFFLILLLASCVNTPVRRVPAQAAGMIAAKVDGRSFQIPELDYNFGPTLNDVEVDFIRAHIERYREQLGAVGEIGFYLKYQGQGRGGLKTYVRFQQSVRRTVRKSPYFIDIQGATIVAVVEGGRLKFLNSALMTPPHFGLDLKNPGFIFDVSDTQLAKFIGLLKSSETSTAEMEAYLGAIARRAGMPFNFTFFLNRQLSEQRVMLNLFFGNLGAQATARLLVDLGIRKRLTIVKRGAKWMIQVTGFFGLPVEFDVEQPADENQKLRVKNIREEFHRLGATISAFESPHYPGGKKTPSGAAATNAAHRMSQIVGYFNETFGWSSFGGVGSSNAIDIHTQLKSVDFRENAAWLGSIQKFVIGEGGGSLYHLDNSISVLGHEFAHAVLQNSSALAYRGESGALNEHFADLQGATIEAVLERGGVFDYTIGKEVLTPAVQREKENLLDLIIPKYGYTAREATDYSLNKVGLRHLYAPALSYATQYDTLKAMTDEYSTDCEPSIDNDNCGVHSASGIPNKAAALIISKLGLLPTRTMFFNTLAYRLNANATFIDYLNELYEECLETPELASKCRAIPESFAVVGVTDGAQAAAPAPVPQRLPLPENASSPTLNFCGWVDYGEDDSIRIFDDKYNANILVRNNPVITKGGYAGLRGYDCACVNGRVTQTMDSKGATINAFLELFKFEDRGRKCAEDPRLANKKPVRRPTDSIDFNKAYLFCGWVSVNSRSKNVTIIDNRYDPAILASGYNELTRGRYSSVYDHQCACVSGVLMKTVNSVGTVFNAFKQVTGITPRSYEKCVGIQWKVSRYRQNYFDLRLQGRITG